MIGFKKFLTNRIFATREENKFAQDVVSDKNFPDNYDNCAEEYNERCYTKMISYLVKDKKTNANIMLIFCEKYIDYLNDCNSYTITEENMNKHKKELFEYKAKVENIILENE